MTASATDPSRANDRPSESIEVLTPELTRADRLMLSILRLPEATGGTEAEAQSAFQKSIIVSAVRCLITYIFLPFIAPIWGVAASIGEPLGIAVALVAMVSIVISMRRFWRTRHGYRWHYTALGGVMMCFLVFLLATDISNL